VAVRIIPAQRTGWPCVSNDQDAGSRLACVHDAIVPRAIPPAWPRRLRPTGRGARCQDDAQYSAIAPSAASTRSRGGDSSAARSGRRPRAPPVERQHRVALAQAALCKFALKRPHVALVRDAVRACPAGKGPVGRQVVIHLATSRFGRASLAPPRRSSIGLARSRSRRRDCPARRAARVLAPIALPRKRGSGPFWTFCTTPCASKRSPSPTSTSRLPRRGTSTDPGRAADTPA